MGFLLNDALIIAKARCNLEEYDNLYTLGKPRSFVLSKDLKFIFQKNNLKKIGINYKIFDNKLYEALFKYSDNKIITFKFFSKLIKFKNNFSIDIDKKQRPNFLLDITNFNNSKKFFNKADLIYDTGSLGYTYNIIYSLNNLSKILKKNGIIIHSLPSNGYVTTGNVQFNKIFLKNFYNSIRYQILFAGFAFYQNYFSKFIFFKPSYRCIDIDANPSIRKLSNMKNVIFFVVRKSSQTKNIYNLFFKRCFSISIFFRRYLKIIFVF